MLGWEVVRPVKMECFTRVGVVKRILAVESSSVEGASES